jgi:ATP-binding cassette subfamily B protein
VLDHGSIIEQGSHDELIANKGTYYRLYTGAFEME